MTAPDPRLEEIEGRLSKATPGPWHVRECPPCTERGRLEVNIWDEPGNLLITTWCDDDEFHRPDAEFIAAAPADVAYLLAELRKAQDKLARVAAEVSMWERDDQEHLNQYGQHLPCSIAIPAERIRAAVADATGGGEWAGNVK